MNTVRPRRRLLQAAAGSVAALAWPTWAQAPSLVDGAGRKVPLPRRVERVLPAGAPAAILRYTLAPDLLLGWPRANRPEEAQFLLPEVAARPALGRLTGRGGGANLESVLALKPDLIVDSGSVRATFAELADRVQAQTGVPYALLDGRFPAIGASYETLGRLTGREVRARELAAAADDALRTVHSRIDAVPADKRPRVYYARGPAGLQTGLGGSINVEILDVLGLNLVTAGTPGGLANVSLEQVLAWDPEVIITIDRDFAASVRDDPLWRGVRAVRDGRVHLSPKLPFGWVDFPPGVNRLPGLWWLGKLVFPDRFPEDLAALTKQWYRRLYHVEPTEAQVAQVLAGRG